MALHRNRSRSQAVADKACIVGGRKLGRVQAGVLKAMLEMGTFPGTWQWKTASTTRTALDALVKRGLVVTEDLPRTDWRGYRLEGALESTITFYRPAQWMRDVMDASTDEDATKLLEATK